jgi:predicted DNA binding protein
LTEKQRTVLSSAFDNGYYDMPRRIDSKELAEKLDLRSSTFIEHRRKAERRLLASVLSKS